MECKADKDWKLLKEFDAEYDCIEVDVYPYESEEPIKAHIFVMDLDESENANLPTEKLPQERYVKVIATGMHKHGVVDEYIDYSILNAPYITNRKPDNYLTFPDEKGKHKAINFSEYEKKARKKAWFLIANRIIQLGQHDPDSPFVEWMTGRIIGKQDCTWIMLQTLYDPDLPECMRRENIQSFHIAWAENQLAEKLEQADLCGTVVGTVKETSVTSGFKIRPLSASIKKFSIEK